MFWWALSILQRLNMYEIGSNVLASFGGGFQPGVITKLAPVTSDNQWAYEIRLEDGTSVLAPEDHDSVVQIRRFQGLRFQPGIRVWARIDQGWEPGTITSTEFVDSHMNQWAYTIDLENGTNPFIYKSLFNCDHLAESHIDFKNAPISNKYEVAADLDESPYNISQL